VKLISVRKEEANQRLDKLLSRYLKEAPKSFLYKMLRKKNITLNGKKADGSEKVQAGDEIRIFLADETYEKFAGKPVKERVYPTAKLSILYEDEHILLVDKPAGMLTQKAEPKDISLNEYLLGYLQKTGQWSETVSVGFKPSVCNRLDRNTSGIVVCGKSLAGLQQMSELFRNRNLHKYYQCLVAGMIDHGQRLEGWLYKDPSTNMVQILKEEREDAQPIITEYRPLKWEKSGAWTLLEVCLITGRSHQIRAHLASIGHPIIGDYKYGDRSVNEKYRKDYGVSGQLLHSYRLELPDMQEPLSNLSGKIFEAPVPARMQNIIMKH
jgi:23S rRNA pseudouridine955/2504/2580 synthase